MNSGLISVTADHLVSISYLQVASFHPLTCSLFELLTQAFMPSLIPEGLPDQLLCAVCSQRSAERATAPVLTELLQRKWCHHPPRDPSQSPGVTLHACLTHSTNYNHLASRANLPHFLNKSSHPTRTVCSGPWRLSPGFCRKPPPLRPPPLPLTPSFHPETFCVPAHSLQCWRDDMFDITFMILLFSCIKCPQRPS